MCKQINLSLPRATQTHTRSLFSLYILTLLFSPSLSHAETVKSLNLDQAIEKAIDASPVLQKSHAAMEEVKWKSFEGFSAFLPTLQIQANHIFEKKYELLDVSIGGAPVVEIPQIFPTSSATLNANWLLFDGLNNFNTYKATQSLKVAALAEDDWTRFQLVQDVKLQYARVVAAKKLKEVAELNLKTLLNHEAQINLLKKGGVSTHYDVLRVEAQLSEAQAELLQAEDNIVINQEKLAQLLGTQEKIDTDPHAQLENPDAKIIQPLEYQDTHEKRKDLVALENKVNASDSFDSASGSFWVPKIGLGTQFIYYNNLSDSLSDYSNYRKAWSAGFFLTWDIFNPRSFAQSKEEKYKAIQAQKNLAQANLQAPVDFAFWKKRYLYSATLFDAKKVDLSRAEETVRLADAGYKAGVRTTTEVLDAELDLFKARAGIVNSQINCLEAKNKLELSLGASL